MITIPIFVWHIFVCTNDPLQQNGCKLSVLLTFHISSSPISRLENLASREAFIDYKAIRIFPELSRGYELSFGTSLAKVGHDGCIVLCAEEK